MDATTNSNARNSNRMSPTQTEAVVSGIGDQELSAKVHDESFGGIGIEVSVQVPKDIAQGAEVRLQYGGVDGVALVRHVSLTDDGSRLGLEWKAQALSRCLRDLLSAETKLSQDLNRILPGGLSMMWKLHEARRWPLLLGSADRLRREVAATGIYDLSEHISEFESVVQSVIDGTTKEEEVTAALNALIRRCIRLID